jgi:predicted phage terminase large subunit-like protein
MEDTMKDNRRALAAIQDELLTRRAKESLRAFVECAWPVLEPATPFRPNWHIDLMCEYLEAITAGELHRLVVNIPPRYMKSLLTSVLWPSWEWIRRPSNRWLFISYAESLASRHSLDRRRLLRSPWFQGRWGQLIQLVKDQQAKLEFHNTRRGAMVATSMGGAVTGKGGNRIVLDDPHNPMQAESDTQRDRAIEFFNTTISTRLDDQREDAIVLVMQRLHTRDLTAVCLDYGYELLSLPAIAPQRTVIVFPRTNRELVREQDDVLWPERQGLAELEQQREVLGSYGFAGQYQQQPVPRETDMFRREWWEWFDMAPAKFDSVLQSWDLSFKDGDRADYVVGLVAGRVGAKLYILDRYKAKASFVASCEAIKRMTTRYPETREILIEEAANGAAVVDVLRQQIRGVIAVKPDGGKFARANSIQPQLEARQVYLPRPRWPDGQRRPEYGWVDDFVDTCATFPLGEHDDDVDALSQLLLRCHRKKSALTNKQILAAMCDDDSEDDNDASPSWLPVIEWFHD